MAQVNSTFYDLVIPKLYETITITQDNKHVIDCGLHSSPNHRKMSVPDENGVDEHYSESLPKDYKSRKDRAIEWCVRLVVDTPVEGLVRSIEYIVDLLPQDRLGSVEELVYTRRALVMPEHDDDVRHLHHILPPFTPAGATDGDIDQLPKTKRVILHLSDDVLSMMTARQIIRPLGYWCKRRRHDRRPAEFVIYDLELEQARYHFDYMNVECHFRIYDHHSPGALLVDFLDWLWPFIRFLKVSSFPRLKLFDLHPIQFTDEAPPTGPTEESLQQIHSIVETRLKTSRYILGFAEERRTELVRTIMERFSFHESENEQGQYPISRPIPVRPPPG
jgi:hypothetical protein